jgi:hypothetical protein
MPGRQKHWCTYSFSLCYSEDSDVDYVLRTSEALMSLSFSIIEKKSKKRAKKKKKDDSPQRLPAWSPTAVLTLPVGAWLRRSDEMRHFLPMYERIVIFW